MDFDSFMRWAGAAALVLTIINTVWIMAGRGAKTFTDRQDKHSDDLKDHDRRIQALEGEQKHAPSGKEVHDLRVTAERLDVHVRALDKSIETLARQFTRIDDYLREAKQ
jgi:tRNA threonylcarbamoyladenosine modification (KEOPS) complex  Pcc1 subunit